MTPKEIVEAACVSGTKGVFILGCFERRVTVYSQQLRALNLVDAMLSQAKVRQKGGKVAIVGGGVAGMTAAIAFVKAAPELAKVDLFESRPELLQLQRNSRRFLHPHFYDWPAPGSDRSDAGLPLMNWQAGPAGDVAKTLCAEFEEAVRSSPLKVHTDDEVVELKSSKQGPVRVVTRTGPAANRIYDAVILAVGFGIERFLGSETSSYWTPSELSAPILANVHAPLIFISGNGDGGLVDFQMAAFANHEHMDICQLLIDLDLGAALAELENIEEEAWTPGADVDLLSEYRARVREHVPSAVWAAINERLRPNVRICLHTQEPRLLRRDTALHNRLMTFLVLEADSDEATGIKAITVKTGMNFERDAPPMTGGVALVGEPAFQPFKRCLRLGADKEANLKPFNALLAEYRAEVEAVQPIARPMSPQLTTSAVARFEQFRVAAVGPVVPPAPAVRPLLGTKCVALTFAGSSRVTWAGNIGPADIHRLWQDGSTVDFYCDVSAADAARLLPAIARVAGHNNSSFTLFVRDTARWRGALNKLWSDRSHPGPNLSFHCSIEEWHAPPALGSVVEMSIGELADMIHERLDADTLNAIHEALFATLGPLEAPTGWVVEPTLREQLWILWQEWRDALTLENGKRRRFLRLLASVNDKVDVEEAALVRVGRKIANRYLAMPTLFALAFAACSGRQVSPAAHYPGNVAVDVLTGHACGVEWIECRSIRGRLVGQLSWTTSVVLLSELSEAVQLVEGDLRLDQVASDPPRVGVPSFSERPIVIGADGAFLNALEEGTFAVQRFFQSIFQRRADAARKSLEEVGGA